MPAGNNPFALDRITPNGTITELTANHSTLYGNADSGQDLWASVIQIQMSKDSPGPKGYFGYRGMDKTTGVGVIREVLPGETFSFGDPRGGSLLHVGDYCLLGDDNTDFFQASAWVS